MKLYVYCVAEALDAPPRSLAGISGSDVRLVTMGNLSLLVSDFSGEVVPVNRENALQHAAVVRSILERTTPLPFRFGTLVTGQELEDYLTGRQAALSKKLEQVRGCVEMSVKIIGDRANREARSVEAGADDKPGTAFLLEKRRQILGSERAQAVAAWLAEQVGSLARETQVSLCPAEKLLLAASHLVERGSVQQYRDKLTAARAERPKLRFLVSGPWPPYSFANIDS